MANIPLGLSLLCHEFMGLLPLCLPIVPPQCSGRTLMQVAVEQLPCRSRREVFQHFCISVSTATSLVGGSRCTFCGCPFSLWTCLRTGMWKHCGALTHSLVHAFDGITGKSKAITTGDPESHAKGDRWMMLGNLLQWPLCFQVTPAAPATLYRNKQMRSLSQNALSLLLSVHLIEIAPRGSVACLLRETLGVAACWNIQYEL